MKKQAALIIAIASLVGAIGPTVASAADKRVNTWADIAKLPDFWTGTWQGISPMVDGPVDAPHTAKAKQFVASYKPQNDIGFGGADCKTPGMPMVMQIAAMPIKFMIEPGMIAIYIEGNSQTRFIHMDQKVTTDVNPTYLGTSFGRWEGDTLVVESVGFVDDILLQYGVLPQKPGQPATPATFLSSVVFGPHGPNLRMVERMRLTDAETLEITNSIYDDTVWTKPYQTKRVWKRKTGPDAEPLEWVCTNSVNSYDAESGKHVAKDPEQVLRELEGEQR